MRFFDSMSDRRRSALESVLQKDQQDNKAKEEQATSCSESLRIIQSTVLTAEAHLMAAAGGGSAAGGPAAVRCKRIGGGLQV